MAKLNMLPLLVFSAFQAACFVVIIGASSQSSDVSATQDQQLSTLSVREYCHRETFQPRCRQGEVIVMETALFGRMRVGRCIVADAYLATMLQYDPSSLGCSADVLSNLDRVCSGKQSCDVSVGSSELHEIQPCSPQLMVHLEASFACAAVVDDDRSCSVSVSVGSRLHISTSTTSRHNTDSSSRRCGSRDHPWMLEAQTGQQINIRLLDFTGGGQHVDTEQSTGHRVTHNCRLQYGRIVDKADKSRSNVSICASGDRYKLIYTSVSNAVEIVFENIQKPDADDNFLIGFEAVGCSNLVPPADAWLKRTDNEATIGCYLSRHRWTLHCVDNQWKGTIGTCSSQVQYDPEEPGEHIVDDEIGSTKVDGLGFRNSEFVQVLSIVATSFVGLAVCLIIIFVGIGCARRYRQMYGQSKCNGSTDVRNLLPGNNDVNSSRSVNTVKSVYRDGQQQQQQQQLPQYFVLDSELVADHNSRIIPVDGSC